MIKIITKNNVQVQVMYGVWTVINNNYVQREHIPLHCEDGIDPWINIWHWSLSFNNAEQYARKHQTEYHDERQAQPCTTYNIGILLQCHCGHVVATVVVSVIQCLPPYAGLSLASVYFYATGVGHSPLPIPVILNATAM